MEDIVSFDDLSPDIVVKNQRMGVGKAAKDKVRQVLNNNWKDQEMDDNSDMDNSETKYDDSDSDDESS
jgi:hypothetical protein